MSQSQHKLSQSRRQSSQKTQRTQLSEDDKYDLVNNTVRYIINMMGSKEVIRRSDIVKNVLENSSKHFNVVMSAAQSVMDDTYGLTIHEIPDEQSNKNYLVINKLSNPIFPISETDKRSYSLLLLVLAHILLSGGSVVEGSIMEFLKRLEIITDESYEHDHFGDVKNLIQHVFTKKQYLSYVKERTSKSQMSQTQSQVDHPTLDRVMWGPRAEEEISEEKVMDFFTTIYGRRISIKKNRFQSQSR